MVGGSTKMTISLRHLIFNVFDLQARTESRRSSRVNPQGFRLPPRLSVSECCQLQELGRLQPLRFDNMLRRSHSRKPSSRALRQLRLRFKGGVGPRVVHRDDQGYVLRRKRVRGARQEHQVHQEHAIVPKPVDSVGDAVSSEACGDVFCGCRTLAAGATEHQSN